MERNLEKKQEACILGIDMVRDIDNGLVETKLSFYANLNEFLAKKCKNACTEK